MTDKTKQEKAKENKEAQVCEDNYKVNRPET